MSWVLNFYRSAVGKKAVMAVTGIALFGFVLAHMLGNLKAYLGADEFNHYAEWLRTVGSPLFPEKTLLWIFRIGLAVVFGLHVHAAVTLTWLSRKARPERYKRLTNQTATYASRTMRWGGVILALFVLYHLAHFTWGLSWAHPDFIYGDPYHNLVAGFSVWPVAAVYVVANLVLGLHLYHGLWSLFQSLGWNPPRFNSWRRRFAQVFAVVITAGNLSFPLAVLTGVVS